MAGFLSKDLVYLSYHGAETILFTIDPYKQKRYLEQKDPCPQLDTQLGVRRSKAVNLWGLGVGRVYLNEYLFKETRNGGNAGCLGLR